MIQDVNNYKVNGFTENKKNIEVAGSKIIEYTTLEKCNEVRECISQIEKTSTKLQSLRAIDSSTNFNAFTSKTSEFCRGILNILGGILALGSLAALEIPCFIFVVIPTRGKSPILPGYCEMAELVKKGASRCGNAFKDGDKIRNEIVTAEKTAEENLAKIPVFSKIVTDIGSEIEIIKQNIAHVTKFEEANEVTAKKHELYQYLASLNPEDNSYVKLVNELELAAKAYKFKPDNGINDNDQRDYADLK